MTNINNSIPDLVEPACPHFGVCGGCALQHLSAEAYGAYKKELVVRALVHLGIEVAVHDPILFPPHSRRRCNLKAARIQDKIHLGYHEIKSHNIVDISVCPLVVPEIEALFSPLRVCLKRVLHNRQKADLFIAMTDSGIDILLMIEGVKTLEFEQTEALIEFARSYDLARISYKYKNDTQPIVTFRQPYLTYGDVAVETDADGFMQASDLSDKILTQLVIDSAPGSTKRAVDLFCGRGTYTLPLSTIAKVDAFELDSVSLSALERAKNKSQRAIRTSCRNLFEDPLSAKELDIYDFAVINPPRAGALQQCRALALCKIPVVTMVSCDPRTFARDAKILIQGGYHLISTTPVDQFLWSNHIEVVGMFSRSY